MNGPKGVAWATTISTLSPSSSTTIGSSHHSLRAQKNPSTSPSTPARRPALRSTPAFCRRRATLLSVTIPRSPRLAAGAASGGGPAASLPCAREHTPVPRYVRETVCSALGAARSVERDRRQRSRWRGSGNRIPVGVRLLAGRRGGWPASQAAPAQSKDDLGEQQGDGSGDARRRPGFKKRLGQ